MASKSTLATKVKKFMNDELEENEIELICGVLRSEKGYGRAVLKKIGTSALVMYDELSRRGDIEETDYSFLIEILRKAELGGIVNKLEKLIKAHQPAPPARPQDLSTNGLKRQASSSAAGIDNKRQRFSQTSGGSQRSVDSIMSPDGSFPIIPRPPEKCYSVERGKGLVAIINNFTDHSDSTLARKGTMQDERSICDFFERQASQSYELLPAKHDLNCEDFKQALEEWVQMLESKKDYYHSFFLFILSHGDEKGVMTFHDGRTDPPDNCFVSVDEINNKLQGCLRGNPKVVIIQAGQGEKIAVAGGGAITSTQQSVKPGESNNELRMNVLPPDTADMLTAFATVKGYQAYRMYEGRGSWFIQNLMQQLESSRQDGQDHLLDILTSTHYDVSAQKGKADIAESTGVNKPMLVQQMPCFLSTLRKKFYLFPRRS